MSSNILNNYELEGQMGIFDYIEQPFSAKNYYATMKQIRLIELFSGIGSQAMAMRDLGISFEHYRTSEWDVNAVLSYYAIHCSHDKTDYSKEFTFDQLVKILDARGTSVDGKKPLPKEKIRKKGEAWCRKIYNAYMATRNIGSVITAKGEDLGIVDKDKYAYILTYSFPCQDLSLAGKMRGMERGSDTSSSLLWQVERLLRESSEKPDILLMENVTQVHANKNIALFEEWLGILEDMGYSSTYFDINAKDMGIPQNRDRCFCVSILGDYDFEPPVPMELTKCMADLLEAETPDEYYITSERAQNLINNLIMDGKIPSLESFRGAVDSTSSVDELQKD